MLITVTRLGSRKKDAKPDAVEREDQAQMLKVQRPDHSKLRRNVDVEVQAQCQMLSPTTANSAGMLR
jgi:hypothetical protein